MSLGSVGRVQARGGAVLLCWDCVWTVKRVQYN